MADNEAAAKRGKGEKRRAKAAGGEGAKGGEKKKKKNPVILEARKHQLKQLRSQGTPEDQVKEKLRAHMKTVVKPAIGEAKSGAAAKNLKGQERKKFIEESVRTKLGFTGH